MRIVVVQEILTMALQSIWGHKLRSFLTVLGIVIGITAVVGMTGLLRGLDQSMKSQLLALDSDIFFVSRIGGRMMSPEDFRRALESRPIFTRDDARAIARACPDVAEVSVMVDHGPRGPMAERVAYRGRETDDTMIAGVSSNHLEVYHISLSEGRFFTDAEDRAKQDVIVLGASPAKALFTGVSPLGKTVRLGTGSWRVVGVLDKRKEMPGAMDLDDFVLVPATTYERLWRTEETGLQLAIRPADGRSPMEVQEEVVQFLRHRRGLKVSQDNNFDVMTQDTLLDLWKKLTQTIMLALTSLSSVALMVGGIGVMAVMLVTVTERTCEIGVRMALGARRRDVLLQFVIEAAVLTTLGGLTGVAVGAAMGYVLTWLTGLPVSFPAWSYAMAVGSSSVVGLVAGVYPAWRASNLDPIEALRHGKA